MSTAYVTVTAKIGWPGEIYRRADGQDFQHLHDVHQVTEIRLPMCTVRPVESVEDVVAMLLPLMVDLRKSLLAAQATELP